MEIFREQNVATHFAVPLINASSRPSYRSSPTLAAGDVKVIRHTGGVWNVANIGTLPSPITGALTQLDVTLTATEVNPDGTQYPVIVQFVDQTGPKEWDDQTVIVWTRPQVANVKQWIDSTPSALQTGRVDAYIGAIAAGAVDAAAIADAAIDAATFAAGAINAAAIASSAIAAAKIASGAITSAKFASGAIDAAAIATDAIGAAEFSQAAADKVWATTARTLTAFSTALAVSVWDVLVSNIITVSSIGKKILDWLAGTDVSTPTTNMTKVGGSSTSATKLSTSADTMITGTVDTTAFAPTTTEFETSSITDAVTDHYKGRIIIWTSGGLIRQAKTVTAYSLQTGRGHFTCEAFTSAPSNTDAFIVV